MSRSSVLEVLLLLLAALIKVYAKLKCSNNLLMCLEMSCNDLTEENIEENKDKINNLDNEGKAALHYAVQSGSLRCIKLLLEYGADANIKNSEGQTALHLVYDEEWSCEECTLALLEGGSDPSTTDNEGQTAMFNLNLYKCPECMHQLIKWGGHIDAKRNDGETSLCNLVDQDEEIVKDVYKPYLNTLKELCADPTIKCSDGMTATEKAEDLEHNYLVEVLEEYVNKFECKRNETNGERDCVCKDGHLQWEDMDGGYPYYPVLGGECHAEMLQMMLQDGLDTSATDTNGNTGLMNAVINKQGECVEVLLDHSIDVNHPDNKGKTALWYALKNCKSCSKNGTVQLLIKKGANPYDNHGCSFLMDKELKICDECIEMLCKNGIDPLKECVDSYRNRSECSLGDTKQIQCGEEIQHKCVCRNGTALWNPPLDECKSMKKETESLHGGTGCMVNGVLKTEGEQWLEDCWLYECKEGSLVHTLNPSYCRHEKIIYANHDVWTENCILFTCKKGHISKEQDPHCCKFNGKLKPSGTSWEEEKFLFTCLGGSVIKKPLRKNCTHCWDPASCRKEGCF